MQPKLGYSLKELADKTPFGLSSLYKAINTGQLKAKKFGKKTLVTDEDWARFIDSLPDYHPAGKQAA